MPEEVTPEDVRTIAEFEMLDNSAIESFIDDAEWFINKRVSDVEERTTKKLVKWTAAHLSSMKQQRLQSEGFSDADLEYEGEQGMNLNYTRYGQQVVMMDPTNSLGTGGHYTTAVHSEPSREEEISDARYLHK